MEKSASIKNIATALLKFHSLVGKITKDASNPFFSTSQKKAKYATLSNILEAIREPLENSGLSFTQFPSGDSGLTTILMHGESGEYLQSEYNMSPTPTCDKEKDRAGEVIWRSEPHVKPQALGSAITYARRYALGAILGLNIDDDDDGNAASNTNKTQVKDNPLQDWIDAVNNMKTLDELSSLYNQNKEVIEGSNAIKKLFTDRKAQLNK